MRVERVDSLKGVRDLAPDWERLWGEDASASLFSSFEWVATWLEHFACIAPRAAGDGGPRAPRPPDPDARPRPHLLVAREGEQAVAIAPLVRSERRWGPLPARTLSLPVNGHSPASGFVAPRRVPEVASAVVEHLESEEGWDLLRLGGVPREAPLAAALGERARRSGWQVGDSVLAGSSIVRVTGTWDEYLGSRSHNFRKSLGRAERSIGRIGPTTVEQHEGADAVRAAMTSFVEVDRESWKAESGESIGLRQDLASFYATVAARCAERGRATVWILRAGDEPAAATLCLRDREWLYILKSSFKAKFGSAYLSPTFILVGEILRDAWRRAIPGIDFLHHSAFTERWANGCREYERIVLSRRRPYPMLLRLLSRRRALASLPSLA